MAAKKSNIKAAKAGKKSAKNDEDYFELQVETVDPLFAAALEELNISELRSKKALVDDEQNNAQKLAKNTKHSSSPRAEKTKTIDLHGKNLEDALALIDGIFRNRDSQNPSQFKIITGRGRHSENSGVLVKEVYNQVESKYRGQILEISENPWSAKIGGLPIKGYFTVKLQRKR